MPHISVPLIDDGQKIWLLLVAILCPLSESGQDKVIQMCDYEKTALAYNSPLNLSARLLVGSTERLVKMDRRLQRLTLLVHGYKSINKKLLGRVNELEDYIEMQKIALADMHKWYRSDSTYVRRSNGLDERPADDNQ